MMNALPEQMEDSSSSVASSRSSSSSRCSLNMSLDEYISPHKHLSKKVVNSAAPFPCKIQPLSSSRSRNMTSLTSISGSFTDVSSQQKSVLSPRNGVSFDDSSSISVFAFEQSDRSLQNIFESPTSSLDKIQGVLKPPTFQDLNESSLQDEIDSILASQHRESKPSPAIKKGPMSLQAKLESNLRTQNLDDSVSLEMTPQGLRARGNTVKPLLDIYSSPMQQSSRIFHTCFADSPEQPQQAMASLNRTSFDETNSTVPSKITSQIEFHVNKGDLKRLSFSNPPKIFDDSGSQLVNDGEGSQYEVMDLETGAVEDPSSSSYLEDALHPTVQNQQTDDDAPERLIKAELRVILICRMALLTILFGTATAATVFAADTEIVKRNITIYLITSAAIQWLVLLTFAVYDQAVHRSLEKIMAHSRKSTSIVASLFPKTFRARLMDEASFDGSTKISKGSTTGQTCSTACQSTFSDSKVSPSCKSVGSASGVSSGFGNSSRKPSKVAERDRLQNFFDTGDFFGREPIADTFPQTTVMFLDLAGFTYWAASREPVQVVRMDKLTAFRLAFVYRSQWTSLNFSVSTSRDHLSIIRRSRKQVWNI
jgi:hypothetical protein